MSKGDSIGRAATAAILPYVDARVAELLDDDHINHTAELLAGVTAPPATTR